MNVTQTIATFINETRFDDLPARAVIKAKLAFLDWIGCTLGGSRDRSSLLLHGALSEFSGPPQATIIGHGEKTDIFSAALLNGYSSHVLDYDDVHMGWIGHPSITVFPAITALSEWRKIRGRDFLTAFVVGVEVESRIGAAVMPTHYDRGWHSTATIGHFGAAAAAASVLGLDTKAIVNALGTAGTQAAGLRQMFGTMCKPLHAGKVAVGGLMAAVLAGREFTSSSDIIGGSGGFASVFSDDYEPAKLIDKLGETWEVDSIVFKRHASCYSTHALIECALTLSERVRPVLSQVNSIRCKVAPLAKNIANIGQPQTGLEGKFSQPFCAAVALTKGKVTEEHFGDEMVSDPVIRELVGKTSVVASSALPYGKAVIEVVLNDGRSLDGQIDAIELGLPPKLLQSSLSEKFIGLATRGAPDERIDALIDRVMKMDLTEDVGRVIELLPSTV